MRVHQALRFELDPSNATRGALASHTGASRFAYNWGLALVKARLGQREQIRLAGLRELLPDAGRARVLSATISEEAGRWFVSFTGEVERTDAPARLPRVTVSAPPQGEAA